MHTICADLGSTTTKIIEVDENNKIINKNIYQKEEPKKLLKKFIENNNIEPRSIEAIIITGVGTIKEQEFLKIPVLYIDEFKAIGLGGLTASNKQNAIIASIGTGTAFIKANNNEIKHLGGSRSWWRRIL
jgi:type II pantothenate kinase